ncbi:MAG TPA: glycosyltransferase N-terminal domain-containing protein [Gemmatimonadales bacterium]|jgi:3-deoxy-D-manno-octulosonic-acid transferase
MPRTSVAYRIAATIGVPLVPLVARTGGRRHAHADRLDAPEDLRDWAQTHRDAARPLAWFHAASVGEGLQALAVMNAFRQMVPEAQVIYTHYSPSAEEFAATTGADWHGYLCYDRRSDVEQMLAAAAPDLLVFAKLDLWPELATRASAAGAAVAMVAASVSPDSGRLRWPSRVFARPGYTVLDRVAANSAEDAERLVILGAPGDRITVTGDPRVDSVIDRVDRTPADDPLRRIAEAERTLVAGSTWLQDEEVVLAAFRRVRDAHPRATLIIAPHQPTRENLHRIARRAAELGLPETVRLSTMRGPGEHPLIVIDTVGVLARAYASGSIAYVGGGFGLKGIHSILEPAAWHRPVIIGRHDRGSRDAAMLDAAGALTRLTASDPAAQLTARWLSWLDDPAAAHAAGEAARRALEGDRGAAQRSADLLVPLLRRKSGG